MGKVCGATAPTRVYADVAQLVAHHLAKVRVAGSNPVVRSRYRSSVAVLVTERRRRRAAWPSGLGKGLQSPVRGFDSRRRLVGNNTAIRGYIRAISSVGEHYLDTVGVTGSIPVSPTNGGPVLRGLQSFPDLSGAVL